MTHSAFRHAPRRVTTRATLTSLGVIAAIAAAVSPARADTSFSYSLDRSATTSAGVYRPDGTLVRTLWRKVDKLAGADTQIWDDKDDQGATVAAGTYEVRVLFHDVKYVWEGTIGNTSDATTGNTVMRAFHAPMGMACHGATCFVATGYNEGQNCMKRIAIAKPQAFTDIGHSDAFTGFEYVATDGVRTYWANNGGFAPNVFVVATNVSDDAPATFANGTDRCLNENGGNCYPDQHWPSIIDEVATGGHIAGLAVQSAGDFLIVAHDGRNELHVVHKTTGAAVHTEAVTKPRAPVIDPSGNLWVIVGDGGTDVVRKYVVGTNGDLTAATTLSGFAGPVALAISPDGNTLLVADGGSSQQVKAFDSGSQAERFTLGSTGGYTASPDVSNDKFDFSEGTLLAFQPDGSFWVGETGLRRVQHFGAPSAGVPAFVDRLMYLPHSYSAGADSNDPTRVFSDFLEFRVDYTKPLAVGNGSWELRKNWRFGTDPKFQGFATGIGNAKTLSNGRTYAVLSDAGKRAIVELPATGHLRDTGIRLETQDGTLSFTDAGDLRYATRAGNEQAIIERKLTGFDAAGNPTWGDANSFGSASFADGDPIADPVFGPYYVPVTSSNVAVTLSAGKRPGFHLGGIAKGGTQWLWKASPSGPLDGLGTYDVTNSIQYAGNVALSWGRHIVYGYHGEFWQDSQASQWMHFHDDGLFIGQFGTYGNGVKKEDGAVAGFAGNSFSPSLVRANCATYLWHNDESNHAGVIRWRIDGLDDVREVSGSGPLGGTLALATVTELPPKCVPVFAAPDGGAEPSAPPAGSETGSDAGGRGESVGASNGSTSSQSGDESGCAIGSTSRGRGASTAPIALLLGAVYVVGALRRRLRGPLRRRHWARRCSE